MNNIEEEDEYLYIEDSGVKESFFSTRIESYKKSRQNLIDGNINCIPTPFPRNKEDFPGVEHAKYYIVTGNEKSAKCFGKGTLVRMFDGSTKKVENVTIGDLLLGPDSGPRRVKDTHSGVAKMYRIDQNKGGKPFTVNGEHILHLSFRKKVVEISVNDYLKSSKTFQREAYQIQAPLTTPGFIMSPTIDPYFYGLWLGDGDTSEVSITNSDPEVIESLKHFASTHYLKINKRPGNKFMFSQDTLLIGRSVDPLNVDSFVSYETLLQASEGDENLACYISRATKTGKAVKGYIWEWSRRKGDFRREFRDFTGFQKERINREVFNYRPEYRLELLAGLIDSDGYYNNGTTKNSYSIVNKSESMALDIQELAWSLGLRAVVSPRWNNTYSKNYFEVTITGYGCRAIPIKVPRKQYKVHSTSKMYRNFTITPLPEDEFFGFEVDEDHLFLLDDYTIVHNSQSSDFIFLLHPLMYAYKNPDQLSVHVLYFSLEMSKEDKFDQLTCFWLYQHTRGRIRIDTKRLNSLNEVLNPEVIELLESDEYKDFFEFLEAHTIFYESVGNPTGIYHQCKNFAESRGTLYYKEMEWTDNTTKKTYTKKVIDKFVKHNPKEYWIAITDHYTLLTPEGGMDLRNTVGRFSSGYSVRLRNIYGFTMVGIQQQSAESQSNESFKLDRLSPHPGNLAENKSTKNDVNMMIGIYAPWRFNKAMHFDYDIKAFKDNIRFIEIILNRNGSQGATVPLYFDGAVNYFAELPPPNSGDLNQYLDMALRAQGI